MADVDKMKPDNRILPELRLILASLPEIDLSKEFASMRNSQIPPRDKSPGVTIISRMIRGAESEILAKIYEPVNRSGMKLPAVFWMHGGGYVLGHPDIDDGLCERFVMDINCVVVSVDYRLAPEFPYPAAIEDCYAGLRWIADNAQELKVDTSRIAVAGASAGGGLTAALALLARDRGGPGIAFQMPLYPMIDNRNITSSSYEISEKNFPTVWNRKANQIAWSFYLGNSSPDEIPPYATPARASDLAGLPPAYTCVGQLDPFRDETIQYITRLAQAGVPVEFHLYPGCFHGFDSISFNSEIGSKARNEYINAMIRALCPNNG